VGKVGERLGETRGADQVEYKAIIQVVSWC